MDCTVHLKDNGKPPIGYLFNEETWYRHQLYIRGLP